MKSGILENLVESIWEYMYYIIRIELQNKL